MVRVGPKTDERDDATGDAGALAMVPSLVDGVDGAALDEDEIAKGTAIERYMVLGRLGAGAMGVVYAAYDPELDRKVALKLLRAQSGSGDDKRRQERLIREAKAIAKVSHANVVGIFDVGVHEGRVFLAMEYLGGGTLREWLAAKQRPWREIVKMFIDVGQGLAAAHAEGLIHRDFKPDNVLVDKQGKPKVADFGLVRLRSAEPDPPTNPIDVAEITYEEDGVDSPPGATPHSPLTRTGAIAGTPAYMAPEQFLGKRVDGRADQFAFCVALYEALYGERPFAGETVMALAGAVIAERIRNPPKSSAVPPWVRRGVCRGLRSNPENRFVGFEDLIVSLRTDPVARLRRRVGITVAVVVAAVILLGFQRRAEHRRSEFERGIAARLVEGGKAFAEAKILKDRLERSRVRAFALFDAQDRDGGERVWAEARTLSGSFDATLARAQRALEAALALDPQRAQPRDRLSEVVFERAALAELEVRGEDLARHLASLEAVDTSGEQRRRWSQPGSLSVQARPAGAMMILERFDATGPDSRMRVVPVGSASRTPATIGALDPGSYRLRLEKDGHVETRYPFVVRRGGTVSLEIDLPPHADVPTGFEYVPAGPFLYGDHDEDLRVSFLNAAPLHERTTSGFLIGAHEVTFEEWIEFLSSLPRAERAAKLPSSGGVHGTVGLADLGGGRWKLRLAIAGPVIEAVSGEPLVYSGRSAAKARQEWLRLPVVGVAVKDMRAYLDWLSTSGRVPGARFCKDSEWERAARGADGRAYPHSMLRLGVTDANIDATYGRIRGGYGPDEIGSHRESRSPFGLDDMAGNVWEVVENDGTSGELVIRSGCYYEAAKSARSTNREFIENETRSHIVGFRVCTNWPNRTEGSQKP